MTIKINYIKNAAPAAMEHATPDTLAELPGDLAQGANEKASKSAAQATVEMAAAGKLKLVPATGLGETKPSAYGLEITTEQSPLAFAFKYAQDGLPVMLAQPNTKNCYAGDKVALATLDPLAIQAAFNKYPDANVAVVPGLEAGVIVLDIDVKNGKPGMQVLAVLESSYGQTDTLTCSTPSGGRHLYFKHPGGELRHMEIMPGIELMAEAKLMAPPSVVDGKPYQWTDASQPIAQCPAWLSEVLSWTYDGKVCKVATLLSEHWKAPCRQSLCLALAGYMARRNWPEGKASLVVRLIHALSNDDSEDLDKRLHAVKDTYTKFEANKTKPTNQQEPLTGLPEIGNTLGEHVASALMKLVEGRAAAVDNLVESQVDQLNAQYAVVSTGSQVVILRETSDPKSRESKIVLLGVDHFKLWKKNCLADGKPIADRWLASPNRRQYEGIVFSPGENTPGFYNLWQGFPIQPASGDCSKFLQHIQEVICKGNVGAADYVFNWCAHLVQRPAELPEVALVLRGLQGTGKGIFARTLARLVGAAHSVHLTSMNQIVGRFNQHLAGKLFIFADEALWGGNRQSEGALKALITEPTISIEPKGKDIFSVHNYTRLVVASNANWAVPLDLDDRRFLVLDVSDIHKEDTAYFAGISAELDGGGLAALMQVLLDRDLSKFNVRAMPKTGFGLDMKLKSAGSMCQWWHELLFDADENEWRLTVEKGILHAEYLAWCKAQHVHHPGTKELFGKELKKFEPEIKEFRPAKKVSWQSRSRWFKLPALPKCRSSFQAYCKCGPEIWEG